MADIQEQNLTLGTSIATTDYVRSVATPGAAPESQNITFDNFQKSITTLNRLTVPTMQVRTTADFDKTSNTTLNDIPGLSVSLTGGRTYRFTARLHAVANTNGGVKVAMGGTCTPSAIIYDGLLLFSATTKQERATSLGTAICAATTASPNPYIEITGLVSVSVDGSLTVQFAQNASYSTKSTVKIGSTLFVEEVA
jgi:hypothetical protein